MDKWFEKFKKQTGYNGCRNCKHQIDVLRTCKWHETTDHNTLHLICPRWEKRDEDRSD